jgi:Outer membrane protein beta-barrel domain/PEGA domain
MHALIRTWIVCVGVACASVVLAAPKSAAPKSAAPKSAAPRSSVRAKYKLAVQFDDNGEAEKALAVIEEGLAIAPKDLPLLSLKGTVLLKLRDYTGALAAYQAYLDAGATGANRREAQKIVSNLGAVQSTFLDITLANGPAAIYLDSKTQGVFCTSEPLCHKAVLPGEYKVIAERPGFERWTSPVTVEKGKTATLAVTLVEKPSLLTVRVAQPGARVTVDDTAYGAPIPVAAGVHRVVVSLAGFTEERIEVAAHEGKPAELDVVLTPRVAIHVEPSGATLTLDGKPVVIEDGSIALPPGDHVLVARAQGFLDGRIEIPAVRAPDDKLAIELASVPPPAPPAPLAPQVVDMAAAEPGEAGASEAGVYMGGFISNYFHQFYDIALFPAGDRPELERLSPELGARFLYLFAPWIGVEGEGSMILASTKTTGASARIYGLGAQLIAQYPGRVTPFVDLGIDLMHLSSDMSVLGSDTDFPIHLGGGARVYVTRSIALRADARFIRGPSLQAPYTLNASYGEFSLGVSFAPSARQRPPRPARAAR